jgi:hypothetical protein
MERKKRKIDMEQDEFQYVPLSIDFKLKIEESPLYIRRKNKQDK